VGMVVAGLTRIWSLAEQEWLAAEKLDRASTRKKKGGDVPERTCGRS
jgi:hypothetical protein